MEFIISTLDLHQKFFKCSGTFMKIFKSQKISTKTCSFDVLWCAKKRNHIKKFQLLLVFWVSQKIVNNYQKGIRFQRRSKRVQQISSFSLYSLCNFVFMYPLCNSIFVYSLFNSIFVHSLCNSVFVYPLCDSVFVYSPVTLYLCILYVTLYLCILYETLYLCILYVTLYLCILYVTLLLYISCETLCIFVFPSYMVYKYSSVSEPLA